MTPITFSQSLFSTNIHLLGHFVLSLHSKSLTAECCEVLSCQGLELSHVRQGSLGFHDLHTFPINIHDLRHSGVLHGSQWTGCIVSLIAQRGTNIIRICKVELGTVWEVNRGGAQPDKGAH